MVLELVCAYQRVLLPTSLASWYSGSDGTTVGTGETVEDGLAMRASTGSTIILMDGIVCFERWEMLLVADGEMSRKKEREREGGR